MFLHVFRFIQSLKAAADKLLPPSPSHKSSADVDITAAVHRHTQTLVCRLNNSTNEHSALRLAVSDPFIYQTGGCVHEPTVCVHRWIP